MAFYGSEFIFDDVPCSEYGLMVYNFTSEAQEDVEFKSGEAKEDRIASRYDALMYGLVQNESLEYTLVFGVVDEGSNIADGLDRYDIEAIASWLTGHQQRKWLSIVQPDMEAFRYKCYITNLKLITKGNVPYGFSCKVICDSPFAYTYPVEYEYSVDGTLDVSLFNESTFNGFYKPTIEISLSGEESISIVNKSDGNRTFAFSSLPAGAPLVISVDNKNQVITNNLELNLYSHFNNKFFRMVRLNNDLTINGTGTVKFVCEFPVNVGG